MGKLKLCQIFMLCSLMHVIVVLCDGLEPIDKWFQNLNKPSVPKTTIIQFYVQDLLGGPGQTVWPIANASITSTSPTNFGQLYMSDDLLTSGPDLNSVPVGRGQGLVGFSALNELVVYSSINFVFTSGEYNGSTITMLGRNPLLNKVRELPIVGGTGIFRLARGIAACSTYSDFNATGYAVFKFILYVIFP